MLQGVYDRESPLFKAWEQFTHNLHFNDPREERMSYSIFAAGWDFALEMSQPAQPPDHDNEVIPHMTMGFELIHKDLELIQELVKQFVMPSNAMASHRKYVQLKEDKGDNND